MIFYRVFVPIMISSWLSGVDIQSVIVPVPAWLMIPFTVVSLLLFLGVTLVDIRFLLRLISRWRGKRSGPVTEGLFSFGPTRSWSGAKLADIRWGDADLALVDWQRVSVIGDETHASRLQRRNGEQKTPNWDYRLATYQSAARAYRQISSELQKRGLNAEGDRFAYHAQILQRRVLLRQFKPFRWFGSLLLAAISGYGYKPTRSFITYILVILAFAGAHLLNAQFASPHLTWDEALVLSVNSFHGRGFFTTGISLSDTLARLAAGEAVIGLLIEIVFIATFTQRFFAR